MGDIRLTIQLPVDDEGFLRRECPLCRREFKVRVRKDELRDLAGRGLQSFLGEEDSGDIAVDVENAGSTQLTCPYCGQQAGPDSWWTEAQLAYVRAFAKNILAEMVNEQLIRPLKSRYGGRRAGPVSISLEARELPTEEPWISPEINDMGVIDLPCCGRQIKVDEAWSQTVRCHFCGFPYERDLQDD
jgi:hypothetical protein